jgi:hypothetical protein
MRDKLINRAKKLTGLADCVQQPVEIAGPVFMILRNQLVDDVVFGSGWGLIQTWGFSAEVRRPYSPTYPKRVQN